ncbi:MULTISPECIES: hypothetical protein [Streptosporangium]|uniref:Coiled-coil protein SlyX n=1 Tax=Streptosporangium brasiliense TaxID=47480 RepID=A0ABT9RCI1_9ACTN|nr:hypothetical protein [Streptosporangium brasiliense]MDP9866957.1 putative coiled-coil protein SlyX [Streptosporangium brasiliense]
MPDVAMKSTGQRVTDLESWAFRAGWDLAGIKETLDDLPATVREEVMAYASPMFEEVMNRMATKEDLSALAAEVSGLGTRIDTLDAKVDTLTDRMTSMEGRVDSMDGKLDLILAKLG